MERYLISILLIVAGIFSIVCSLKEYDFFMNHRKAQFMIKIIGRKGARIFYIILGSVILVAGIFFLIFGIPQKV